ncbi:RDD family protein [Clostridium homopropionicum DSM 5847]|uniref:RDD family protein n=1 Tax=Clostridium homopropionicum DSM 5847 TaxID=1121318 RepID=A0A0L6ZE20_9CLOT|nr:RDD family protein [Clostridium homopropionicum]KOA21182.1 RDD family protein [Clostridium homopropionicum DSM 5847]SFG26358.1 RDD family protein [Clostridium homopropionicum]
MLETNNEQEKVDKDVEIKEENIEVENENVTEIEKVEEDTAVNAEVENNEEIEAVEKDSTKINLKDTFTSSIVDLAVTAAATVVGLFLIDAILRVTAGYYIKEKVSFSVIIFVIVSLLYTSIMESSKGETIGKRLLKLKVTRA